LTQVFKARVVVTENTDLDAKIAAVADRAQRASLESADYTAMIAAVRSAAAAMKQSFCETAQQGVFLQATKTVSGQNYEVTVETGSPKSRGGKRPGLGSILAMFKKS
jgi:hypothetical protein